MDLCSLLCHLVHLPYTNCDIRTNVVIQGDMKRCLLIRARPTMHSFIKALPESTARFTEAPQAQCVRLVPIYIVLTVLIAFVQCGSFRRTIFVMKVGALCSPYSPDN